MSPTVKFSENVMRMLFEHIDSVEQLEVLLFMRLHGSQSFDGQQISAELRSSPQSVVRRLVTLEQSGFVEKVDTQEINETAKFRYFVKSAEIDETVADLADLYKLRPQKVLEIIFSPLKKGRQFANAFVLQGSTTPKKGSEDG